MINLRNIFSIMNFSPKIHVMKVLLILSLIVAGSSLPAGFIFGQGNNYIVSKFDFVPGEKVIFYDDFSAENIGDFPVMWLTNGSGEVVTTEKYPGRWFQLTKEGYFMPEIREDFTENFTIEFDIVPLNIVNSETAVGIEFFLLSGSLDAPGYGGQPGQAGMRFRPGYDHIYWDNWSEAREWSGDNGTASYIFHANEKYHISIWVQKQRIRYYVNEVKALDLPRGLQSGYKYNIFRIESSCDANPIIANFRAATGFSDFRKKLLNDGRFIAYGIHFDVNSDHLKPESYSTLKAIADLLKEDATIRLKIIGHTDSDGDEAFNMALSGRRAAMVKKELTESFSIEESRLETEGKGEADPLAPNDCSLNKAKNRRVEFLNLKLQTLPATGSINMQPSGG